MKRAGAAALKTELEATNAALRLLQQRRARAAAALDRAKTVADKHLRKVATLALRHRLRRNPMEEIDSGVRVERALASVLGA